MTSNIFIDYSDFEEEKTYRRKDDLAGLKLKDVFGYVTKTIIEGFYDVLEPKADASHLINKGIKRKRHVENYKKVS